MSARHAVARALGDPQLVQLLSNPLHVIAAGKAAAAMAVAITQQSHLAIRHVLAIGTHAPADMPPAIEWRQTAHPVPDARSVAAGQRALEIASRVLPDETLLILLSGGASALMAVPITGITLEDKQQTIRSMMLAGADIEALNTVRKHLSAIKGGRLAAACRGTTLTLAISDVVGDDLSVIGSGPGVADPSTWADAARALRKYGEHSSAVWHVVEQGMAGEIAETLKPDARPTARTHARVIASQRDAMAAAAKAASDLGYEVMSLPQPIVGEARVSAQEWIRHAAAALSPVRPTCVVSAGETTVKVTGKGRGGRNQEFVLSLCRALSTMPQRLVVASVGTDGIDGPTDAAGALADGTTLERAHAWQLDPEHFLDDNNAYAFFAQLGDLIHLGPTDTNVGDLQVLLAAGHLQ